MFFLSAIHWLNTDAQVLKWLESLADKAHAPILLPCLQCGSWTGEVVWLLKCVEVGLASIITLGFRLTVVMLCGGLLVKFCKENVTWVSKLFVTFFLSVLSIESQRARADIVFMLTFKRFFFLTLDGIDFDNFLPVRISLVTFTLHISVEISQCYFKKILGDNCQFVFQQQSSLVIFFKICFFFLLPVLLFQSVVQ